LHVFQIRDRHEGQRTLLSCIWRRDAAVFDAALPSFFLQDFQKLIAAGMIGASMFVGGAAKAEVDYDGIKVRFAVLWGTRPTLHAVRPSVSLTVFMHTVFGVVLVPGRR
jgi:hypothetical protein